jgi:D-amino peptidase
VLVSDSHGDAQNLDLELLDKRVKVVRAWPRPLLMMQGIDDTFDAAVFVGYHASEWRAAAILAHTMTGGLEIRLNGRVVPEAGLNAAVAGEFGVPVVFVSGDQTIGEEARRLLGPIEAVEVKQATGYYSATMIHPEEAQRLIREGVGRALGRRSELKPYRLERPVKMELVCKETVDAEILSDLPGVERTAGNVVVFTARDAIQASRFLNVVFSLNTFSD